MKDWSPDLTFCESDLVSEPMSGSGYAGTLPVDHEDDTIARLHAVVKEITGKAVEKPQRPRMGFL